MNGMLYDATLWLVERKLLSEVRRELFASLNGDIVELGAGTGASFPYYSPRARVIALEPDRSMAQRAVRSAHASRAAIEVRIASDAALEEFAPKSFDAVVCPLVLCSINDPRQTLLEAYRVLKDEGRLVILEHVRSDGAVGRMQDALMPAWRYVFDGCHLNRSTRELIEASGFDTTKLVTKRVSRYFVIQELLVGYAYPRTRPNATGASLPLRPRSLQRGRCARCR